MNYCVTCVLPDTRPGIILSEDGVCSGCIGHEEKNRRLPWPQRRQEFKKLVAQVKRRKQGYDCLIPVSGGKDSTWQVAMCLEYGLRILAVTWKTPGRTVLGQKNLDNLVRLGVDHIDYTINPDVESRFMHEALVRTGDTALPMHMAIYTIPLRLAAALKIPLVIWGESPHMEYGGTKKERHSNKLDTQWLKTHGILHGTSAEDWIGKGLSRKDLTPYFLPSAKELSAAHVQSIFLGYYFPWDPKESLRVALKNGFQVRKEGPKMGYYNYADIDCDFISVHHYFKWLKFGFTRLFDNLALEIRNGRMTRDQAIRTIKKMGDQTPHDDIKKLCAFLGISVPTFWKIAERYRNKTVWTRRHGKWQIKDFLIPDWKW